GALLNSLRSSDALAQVRHYLIERDADLVARVAVADGDGLIRDRLAVDRDAEGRAGFVHPGVALADALLGVVLRRADLAAHVGVELLRAPGHAFFVDEGEAPGLDRCEPRVEAHQLR